MQVFAALLRRQIPAEPGSRQLLQLADTQRIDLESSVIARRNKAGVIETEHDTVNGTEIAGQRQQFPPRHGIPHSCRSVPAGCGEAAPVMTESHTEQRPGVARDRKSVV